MNTLEERIQKIKAELPPPEYTKFTRPINIFCSRGWSVKDMHERLAWADVKEAYLNKLIARYGGTEDDKKLALTFGKTVFIQRGLSELSNAESFELEQRWIHEWFFLPFTREFKTAIPPNVWNRYPGSDIWLMAIFGMEAFLRLERLIAQYPDVLLGITCEGGSDDFIRAIWRFETPEAFFPAFADWLKKTRYLDWSAWTGLRDYVKRENLDDEYLEPFDGVRMTRLRRGNGIAFQRPIDGFKMLAASYRVVGSTMYGYA